MGKAGDISGLVMRTLKPEDRSGSRPLHPRARVDAAYSDEFLKLLGERFFFHALEPEAARAIRRMGVSYLAIASLQELDIEDNSARRKEMLALKSDVGRLLERISSDEIDFANLLYFAALTSSNFGEHGDSAQNDRETWGEPDYQELIRLLGLLHAAVDLEAEKLAPKRGRRRDDGLEALVHLAANFWELELGRPFTVDHHHDRDEPTEAYEFIRWLTVPFGDVPRERIETVMRNEDAERRKLAKRLSEH